MVVIAENSACNQGEKRRNASLLDFVNAYNLHR